MTEDEAKTKWCPFVRFVPSTIGEHDAFPNRPDPQGDADRTRCVASGCMAWRVRHQWFDNAQQEPDWVSYPPYAFEPGPDQERDDGYCGLAGAPQ